ncbi:MAG: hypothetical protein SGJ19_08760 [Planctomycetia bacterium]|nr:hypothetical protein [Planctomycetia bacterium]
MKPRFSILTLLGITAYLALVIAGLLSEVWNVVAIAVWAIGTLLLFAVVTGQASGQVQFARGFVAGLTWSGITFLFTVKLWQRWLYDAANALRESFNTTLNISELETHILQLIATAIGLVFGTLACWRYRVLERRANQVKSGE